MKAEILQLQDQGNTLAEAALALGISTSAARAWLKRPDDYQPAAKSGRPPMVVPTEEDKLILGNTYVKTNQSRGKGSATQASRMAAKSGKLSPATAQAILYAADGKPRASKHSLPSQIRKVYHDISGATIGWHRSPTNTKLAMGDVPGQLRMAQDGSRRLISGERESWDDATVNFPVIVPWPWGGCPLSDRHGVKLGRFQLLAPNDDGSDLTTGFTFTMRKQASYRGMDVAAACGRIWRDNSKPDRVIFERGVWESHHVSNFMEQAGVIVDRAYSPHTKLIENKWNRLWKALSVIDGQIGRYRGEMERENKLLTRCQSGSLNPEGYFPKLGTAMDAIEDAFSFINTEPVETDHYGKWIPSERHQLDLEQHPRQTLSAKLNWIWFPVQKTWKVRKGLVGGMVQSPYGVSFPYYFACPDLYEYEGAKVRVFFDPYSSESAGLVLAQNFAGRKAGLVLSVAATLVSDVPTIVQSLDGWEAERSMGGFQRAIEVKKAFLSAVRTEYRALGFDGRRKASLSEIRDDTGRVSRIETGTAGTSRQDRAPLAELPSRNAAPVAPPTLDRDALTANVAAMEAKAKSRGQLISI